MGYDDSHLARLAHIDLTTQLARLAVQAAVERLDQTHDGEPRVFRLAPHLVVRGSTGPVR